MASTKTRMMILSMTHNGCNPMKSYNYWMNPTSITRTVTTGTTTTTTASTRGGIQVGMNHRRNPMINMRMWNHHPPPPHRFTQGGSMGSLLYPRATSTTTTTTTPLTCGYPASSTVTAFSSYRMTPTGSSISRARLRVCSTTTSTATPTATTNSMILAFPKTMHNDYPAVSVTAVAAASVPSSPSSSLYQHRSFTSSPFGSGGGGNNNINNKFRNFFFKNNAANSRMASGVGLIGAATVLFGKTKYLLAALKLTKLASLGSMVLTIGTYSMFFGLPYAVGMVGLICVHECGHALVMRHKGVEFSPMVFMPFFGAFIMMQQPPRDALDDALIALGGPALGGLGTAAVAFAALSTQSQLLFALADFGYMVNLFNLLPIGSMDGGRITAALSPYAGLAGLGVGGLLIAQGAIQNPIFYLIWLTGAYDTYMRLYNPDSVMKPPHYYAISKVQRLALTGAYAGLIGALMLGMAANQVHKKPPEVLQRERRLSMEYTWEEY